jgi:hypothetical protein
MVSLVILESVDAWHMKLRGSGLYVRRQGKALNYEDDPEVG